MNCSKSKFWIVISAVLIGILITFLRNRSALGVKYGESFYWAELINIHESPTRWISVNGKKYRNVNGSPPYHLMVPELDLVFFVTSDRRGDKVRCHFVRLKDNREFVFSPVDTYISLDIGKSSDSDSHVRISGANWPNVVVIQKVGSLRIVKYEFNLESMTVKETTTIGVGTD